MPRHDDCPKCGTPAEEEIDYDVIGCPIFCCETCDTIWKVFVSPFDTLRKIYGSFQHPASAA